MPRRVAVAVLLAAGLPAVAACDGTRTAAGNTIAGRADDGGTDSLDAAADNLDAAADNLRDDGDQREDAIGNRADGANTAGTKPARPL